ncbi:response regulator [bacterium]|nr:response regulator [bacterium]
MPEKYSLLVVDDNSNNLKYLNQILEKRGYLIHSAPNARLALTFLEKHTPDLILLDIRMPEMDGFEMCRQLRLSDKNRSTPVIFISALNEIEDKVKAFEAGGVDYIAKPFQAEEVILRVQTHLKILELQKNLEHKNRQLQIENQERKKAEKALKTAHDMLEQKVKERTSELSNLNRALQISEHRFRSMFENATMGMCLINMNKKHTMVNPLMSEIVGYSEEELLNKTFTELSHPDDLDDDNEVYESLVSGEINRAVYEKRYLHKSGRLVHVLVGVFLLRDTANNPVHFVVNIQDISQIKKLEQQLMQAQKMEAIGTLAGGIAHDFNNILSGILGYSQIVKMHQLSEDHPAAETIDKIIKASHRAIDLVKQILTFSRRETSEIKKIRITPIIKESIKLLKAILPSTIAIEQHLTVKNDCVYANPGLIQQIILNFSTNAVQAMRDAGGILSIFLEETTLSKSDCKTLLNIDPGEYLSLTVQDTGKGISDIIKNRIFEPYFTTKPVGEGTGLGLSVVHGIVKDLGGAIMVNSRPGEGSQFKVFLPKVVEGEKIECNTIEGDLIQGKGRVLIVDDELMIAETTGEMLESLGYQVSIETDSIKALERFRDSPDQFDLLLTDMTMPHLRGDQLATAILEIRSGFPVIVCTGFSELMDEEQAQKIGIQHYLMKPVSWKELTNKIDLLLSERT